jgi:hypothetical protein
VLTCADLPIPAGAPYRGSLSPGATARYNITVAGAVNSRLVYEGSLELVLVGASSCVVSMIGALVVTLLASAHEADSTLILKQVCRVICHPEHVFW